MQNLEAFTWLGIIFLILGFSFIFLPSLIRLLASPETLEKIPSIILYVYSSDGFTFATSPLFILVSVILFLISWIRS